MADDLLSAVEAKDLLGILEAQQRLLAEGMMNGSGNLAAMASTSRRLEEITDRIVAMRAAADDDENQKSEAPDEDLDIDAI